MIRAKKTRGEAATDPAQRYALSEGALGGLPHAIAMGILSVALYLRSMVSGAAAPAPAPTPPLPEPRADEGPAGPHLGAEPPATEDCAPQEPVTPPEDVSHFLSSYRISTGQNVVPLFKPLNHDLGGAVTGGHHGVTGHPAHRAAPPNLWDGLREGHHATQDDHAPATAHLAPEEPEQDPVADPRPQPGTPPGTDPDTDTGTDTDDGTTPATPPQPTHAGPAPQPGRPAPQVVPPANRAPVRLRSIVLDDILGLGAIMISTQSLLAMTTDPDGDVLQVTGLTVSSGSLVPVAGGWLYTPDPAQAGVVQFSYRVTDGHASVAQMAHANVRPAEIAGGTADDELTGGAGIDILSGNEGDDVIRGAGGDDVIHGGAGDDVIHGGTGDDLIYGGDGDDIISGEDGDDALYGGAGDDLISGGAGDDHAYGGTGADALDGGAGADLLSGGAGHDVLSGGAGADRLSGGDGDDALSGESGDDVLDGGAGDDALTGGTGDDQLAGGDGADMLSGEAGDDILDGGAGDDVLSGGTGADTVTGGTGSDHVHAGADGADDVFHGDAPDGAAAGDVDTIDYGTVTVALHIDLSEGTIDGSGIDGTPGTGHDRFDGFEVVISGAGDDTIRGSVAGDVVVDGDGADSVQLGDGDDRLIVTVDACEDDFDGGAGEDTLDLSDADEGLVIDLALGQLTGADDTRDRIADFEIVIGTGGDDLFITGTGETILTGGAGADTYRFNSVEGPGTSATTITDFTVGDVIETRRYRIFDDTSGSDGSDSDSSDGHGGLRLDGGDVPDTLKGSVLSFAFRSGDDGETTLMQISEDDEADAWITLHGHHVLIFCDTI